jgi:membrane-associated protease RseP (regulator of RpoE activity)
MAALAAAVVLFASAVPAAEPADRAALEKDLAAARSRLDQSAKEVADLSRQLYGDDPRELAQMMHGGHGPQGAMLGINIGGDPTRDDGVEVMGVSPSGPAQAAGLKTGDVIVAVDGKSLKRSADGSPSRQLVEYLRGVQPGHTVKVDYLRDGKRLTASIAATQAMPPMAMLMHERMMMPGGMEGMMPPGMMDFLGFRHGFGGLELVPITPKLGQYFGTDKGLLVVRAPAEAGWKLEDGDVLTSIDGRVPESPGHALRILGSYQPDEKVKLDVLRNRKRMTIEATLPKADEFGGPRARPLQPRMGPPPAPPPGAPAAPVPPPKPADPV